MDLVIGIDVGGTNIKAGLVDADGAIHTERAYSVDEAARSEDGIVAALLAIVRQLDAIGPARAVGIGMPGVIDAERGIITKAPNYPAWTDLVLTARLRQAGLELPVAVDNDANLVGLGEGVYGAAKGCRSFILLTLGTGVGGALILDGRLWRGEDGMAGELGHMVVDPHGRPCGCGSHGCLEQYASQVGLQKAVVEHAIQFDYAEQLALDRELPRKLAELAVHGHEAAQECWHEMGFWLGLGLASLLNALNVKRVVLAGGVAAALPLFLPTLLETVRERTFAGVHSGLQVVGGTLGPSGGVLGGAALARIALGTPAHAT